MNLLVLDFPPDLRKNMTFNSLNEFMKKYENAVNSRDFNNVQKLVSEDAFFWFTDGTFTGIDSIRSAFEKTST